MDFLQLLKENVRDFDVDDSNREWVVDETNKLFLFIKPKQ